MNDQHASLQASSKSEYKGLGLQTTLLIVFLTLSLLPLGVVSWLGLAKASESLVASAVHELEATSDLTKHFIRSWFDYRKMDIQTEAELVENAIFMKALTNNFSDSGKSLQEYIGSYTWTKEIQKHKALSEAILLNYDYIYDIFYIDLQGNILYTVIRESDLGTNLYTGPYASTRFASAFKKVIRTGELSFSGFERYAPSNNEFSGFVLSPLQDDSGENIGIYALQLRLDRIYDVLSNAHSNNQSLENYIVTEDGTLQSPINQNWQEVLLRKIDVSKAKNDGKKINAVSTAMEYEGPGGQVVFGVQNRITVLGENWVLISEVDKQDVLEPVSFLKRFTLIVLVITSVLVVVVAAAIARRITLPIKALANDADRIAKGGTSASLPSLRTSGEVAMLRNSLITMFESRAKHEKEIEEGKKRLEQVINSTDSGLWSWRLQTGELEINGRWAKMLGFQLQELQPLGINTWLSRVHPDDIHELNALIDATVSGSLDAYLIEIRLQHRDSSWVWVQSTGKIVEWREDGEALRMIGTHVDITQSKHREEELIAAKNDAEQAARAKSEFLACMSHEIRTPMNGVLGMLSLLSGTPLNERQKHQTELAKSSARSLLNLINDILDFSKVEAGKLELEVIEFDLWKLLGDFSESMGNQAQSKGLELVLEASGVEHSFVLGDPSRIRQILSNLVGNALKFTTKGSVLIKASLSEDGEKHWCFSCSIIDSGIGIPEDKFASLFDAFSQVDASTTREFGGTGLGLAIVRQLCQLMGGDISVTSCVDKGSEFTFTIRLQKRMEKNKPLPQLIPPPNVLLMEPNNATAQAILTQLSAWGITATHCETVNELESIFSSQNNSEAVFDLALVDLSRDEQSIRQLFSEIKLLPKFKHLHVKYMVPQRYILHRGEAEHRLAKPITKYGLLNALSLFNDELKQYLSRHTKKRDIKSAQTAPRVWPACTRILLVDDNDINIEVADGILEDLGLSADFASNGSEALNALQSADEENPFTLVLMDCQMPIMDGYEATRRIRAGEAGAHYANIPIIAMTANAMQGDQEKCLQSGMSDYLAKPIEEELLEELLCKWLKAESTALINEVQENGVQDNSVQKNAVPEINTFSKEDSSEVWNEDEALSRVKNKKERLVKLINMYAQHAQKNIDELETAVAQGNAKSIVFVSHMLKGSLANLSAHDASNAAGELESAGKACQSDQYGPLFERFVHSHKRTIELFNMFLTHANEKRG